MAMRKSLIFCRLFVVLFGSFAIVANATPTSLPKQRNDTEHRSVIAILLPLTGELSNMGRDLKNGIELAESDISADFRSKLEIKLQDEAGVPARSVTALQSLYAEGPVSGVIVFSSAEGNAIAPIAEKNRSLMIAIAASDNTITRERSFTFNHWVSPEREAKVLLEEIKRRNYKSIAIAGAEQAGLRAIASALHEELAKNKLPNFVVGEEWFLPTETDFRTLQLKLKNSSPSAIFALLYPAQIGPFFKQARTNHLDVDIFGVDTFDDAAAVAEAGDYIRGSWYVSAAAPSDTFLARFRNRYGYSPPVWAGNAYDSLLLLAKYLNESGGNTSHAAKALREAKSIEGAFGTYSSTGDGQFDLPATVRVIAGNNVETR